MGEDIRDNYAFKELVERVDDLALLADRIESLEDDRNTLIGEVRDIMTAFEDRVLREIQNLTEARIEPIDKVSSGLMLTIADLTASVTALLDIYSDDCKGNYNFSSRFSELKKKHHTDMLQSMKEAHGLSETPAPKENSSPPADGDSKGN